ncbi:MAG TPA: phosphate ABC transporter permease subunit PstC [Bacteroidales bacterium]|nr:MAG: Phosphate transport system permease protein PstC [Bacteroidetes bacterium ADurb.Bin217]HPM12025.1 phosphate ABC transporter permease subunit PstC [Bacteroidales bacterium]
MAKPVKERIIELFLKGSAILTVGTTVGIILVLLSESIPFFREVSIVEFLTDTEWTPLFTTKRFGILPLISGTLLVTFISVIVAVPLGIIIAIFLSEYASPKFRKTVKPMLEILAAVPTVVYGFFALMTVTPLLQMIIPGLSGFNSLSAGIVMGIMIIPLVTSLSEDAMYAVPKSLREASFAMGASRLQTAFKVVVPAAFSGIVVSVILAVARAIGETMIVAIAAGQQPRLTFDPTVPIETITAYIVQVSSGDIPHGSLEYKTIYAAGITLFVLTFSLNSLSFFIRRKFQEKYQ